MLNFSIKNLGAHAEGSGCAVHVTFDFPDTQNSVEVLRCVFQMLEDGVMVGVPAGSEEAEVSLGPEPEPAKPSRRKASAKKAEPEPEPEPEEEQELEPEEPKKPTRTRTRGRSKPAEDVSDEQPKETKKPARKRGARNAGASDGAGDDSGTDPVDAGTEELVLSDLSKAASEAAMVITPAGVTECLEAFGVRKINDLKPEHYARFMATLSAEVAKEEGE